MNYWFDRSTLLLFVIFWLKWVLKGLISSTYFALNYAIERLALLSFLALTSDLAVASDGSLRMDLGPSLSSSFRPLVATTLFLPPAKLLMLESVSIYGRAFSLFWITFELCLWICSIFYCNCFVCFLFFMYLLLLLLKPTSERQHISLSTNFVLQEERALSMKYVSLSTTGMF